MGLAQSVLPRRVQVGKGGLWPAGGGCRCTVTVTAAEGRRHRCPCGRGKGRAGVGPGGVPWAGRQSPDSRPRFAGGRGLRRKAGRELPRRRGGESPPASASHSCPCHWRQRWGSVHPRAGGQGRRSGQEGPGMQPDFLSLLERAGAARGLPTLAPSLRCLTCSGRRGPSWWCWEGGICSCSAARREGCPPLRGD